MRGEEGEDETSKRESTMNAGLVSGAIMEIHSGGGGGSNGARKNARDARFS